MKKSILTLLLLALTSLPFTSVAGDCNYNAQDGKEFFFPKSNDRLMGMWYPFWSKSNTQFNSHPLLEKNYAGVKGKILPYKGKTASGLGSFSIALLETCETVYSRDPWGTMRDTVITYKKDVDEAESFVGKKVTIINNRIEKMKLKSIDGKKEFKVADGELVDVKSVHLTRLWHMRDNGSIYLLVKRSNGDEGLVGYTEKYIKEKYDIENKVVITGQPDANEQEGSN